MGRHHLILNLLVSPESEKRDSAMSFQKMLSREDIERRTFQIYMARGRKTGNDLADWLARRIERVEQGGSLSRFPAIPIPAKPRKPQLPSEAKSGCHTWIAIEIQKTIEASAKDGAKIRHFYQIAGWSCPVDTILRKPRRGERAFGRRRA